MRVHHQCLHVSLEPCSFPEGGPSNWCEKLEWMLKQQSTNAMPLLTDLQYFDLTQGPLSKLLSHGDVPEGVSIQYAYMDPQADANAATVSWKMSCTLPDASTADVATFLESGKLREVSKHYKFLQAPGSCRLVRQLQDVSTSKRAALILYSEHQSRRPSHPLFSQLRVVFRAINPAVSDGTVIIEAPACHSCRENHTTEMMFGNDRFKRADQLSAQGKPVPTASINIYHIQAKESGTMVTIYIAENVHKARVMNMPFETTEGYAFALNLVKTLGANTTKYVASDSWQQTVEMLRVVQQQAALQALDGVGMDDDMKAFVQGLVNEGYDEMQERECQRSREKAEAEAALEDIQDKWEGGTTDPLFRREDDISFVSMGLSSGFADPSPQHSAASADLRPAASAPTVSFTNGQRPTSLPRAATENASTARTTPKKQLQKSESSRIASSSNPFEPVGEFFGNLMKGMTDLVERGEQLTRVNEKTANMEQSAETFADYATKLREEMEAKPWWQRL